MELTKEEAQFLLDNIIRQGVPLDHPDGERVWQIGNSCVRKLQTIMEAEDGTEQIQ